MATSIRSSTSENNSAVSTTAAARAVRDIAKELRSLVQSPPEGIRLLLSGEDADCISVVHAEIDGPVGTPYQGGVFRMKLEFGTEFPNQPPKGYFLTRIFHPNISKTGEICVNTLKRDWKPSLGLRHVLLVIRCLLIEPYPESALNEEAGKMLLDDYSEYAHHARLMTSIHALPRHGSAFGSSSTSAEQSQPKDKGAAQSAKDKARSPAEGAEPLAARGSPAEVGGRSVSPSPLALNSSIVNSEGENHGNGGRNGSGGPGGHGQAHAHAHSHTAGQLEGGAGAKGAQGAAGGKVEKKKVDTRKKALKRL